MKPVKKPRFFFPEHSHLENRYNRPYLLRQFLQPPFPGSTPSRIDLHNPECIRKAPQPELPHLTAPTPLPPHLHSRSIEAQAHMDLIGAPSCSAGFDQNVIVMRHGDRMDNFDPLWVTTAERPWDPPLVDAGRVRAFSTGRLLRSDRLGFQIHRVFVSPFLRCIQTALEATTAICAADDDAADESKKVAADCAAIDPSKVKVSIEYGLCEMLNREAIRQECAPKDGNFHFKTSELEELLPAGIVDHNVERIYEELPRWEETVLGSRARYEEVIKALADKYPSENLLLVTHGEGVGVSVASFLKGAVVYEVSYCAYAHARRHVVFDKTGTQKAESFELVTPPEETGIKYSSGGSMMSDGL